MIVAAPASFEAAVGLRVAPRVSSGMGGGLFDAVGDLLEGARDVVVNVVTLKYLHKGLAWAWKHMGEDMRAIVMKVGPMVAEMYAPGIGGTAAKAALMLLERERVSKAQKKAARRELERIVAEAEASGQLERGVVNLKNPDHLEAIVLAGNMPPDVRAQWFRDRGLAPKGAGSSSHAAPALAVAGLLAMGAFL